MHAPNSNFPDWSSGSWTLFLDRDGVINRKVDNGYVTKLSEFEALPGAIESIAALSQIFRRVIIVSNQRGISRGFYSTDIVEQIHKHLIAETELRGGRIDKAYYCPHAIEDNCSCRKPGTGMAMQAKMDFPEIDFLQSVMVGDSGSDIEFGRRLGMTTVLITPSNHERIADFQYTSLTDFVAHMHNKST
jgi:histidinol-phosphate phosphatase family protein